LSFSVFYQRLGELAAPPAEMPESSPLDTPGQHCRMSDRNPKLPRKLLIKCAISSGVDIFDGLVLALAIEEVVGSLGEFQENSGTGSLDDGQIAAGRRWLG
jgi:hypothetical protein